MGRAYELARLVCIDRWTLPFLGTLLPERPALTVAREVLRPFMRLVLVAMLVLVDAVFMARVVAPRAPTTPFPLKAPGRDVAAMGGAP